MTRQQRSGIRATRLWLIAALLLAGAAFPGTGASDTDNLFLGQKAGVNLTSGGASTTLYVCTALNTWTAK